jgi:hypothetical protein
MTVFEKHHQKKELETAQRALAEWQAERDATAEVLEFVRTFAGQTTADILLKKGEALFGEVADASLVEDRRGPGQWQGRSQGVSIPVGSLFGRTVRYHVGATRGHYVSSPPIATAVDTGTAFVTNQRVVFRGHKQTRECLFDKLISFEFGDGEASFAVSNRQKNTIIHYGTELDDWFRLRCRLALAHFQGTVDDFARQLDETLAELDAARPGLAAAGPSPEVAPAQWAPDPFKRHELRYWDGTAWTEHVSDSGTTAVDPPSV